ncbi:MAG TPA: hypothetical protein D7H99_00690 [Candidatus Poseidoniales archaeon]|nr:MAG TPA: hypothetical protein D7H99_00690 [Candidatus Poseidoniales archaeon]HII57445.1 hypothetical protein [Candidatus Poseidoniaceae archaeon]
MGNGILDLLLLKAKWQNTDTPNPYTMRKIVVALMILFSLMVIPNSIGQNPHPTAAISLDCDSDPIEVSHLYEVDDSQTQGYSVDFEPSKNRDFECVISNPTAYQEVVEISYTIANVSQSMILQINHSDNTAHDSLEITVDASSSENFTMRLILDEGVRYDVEPYISFSVSIYATVLEINGIPPLNDASSTFDNAIIIREILQGSRLGFNVNPYNPQSAGSLAGLQITGQLFNGNSWSNYDYSTLFDSETELPFSEPWNVIQFIDVDCPYCKQVADDMRIYSERYDYNNNTNQNPDVRFITNVADIVTNNVQNSTNGSGTNDRQDIEDFRGNYQHNLIDYIDDLSNINLDYWGIQGIPRTYLIQPDGTFAWDPASYPYVGWSEFEHKPIILDNCAIQSSFPFLPPGSPFGPSYDCDVADAIDYLVEDTDVSPVVAMEIYHGESLENALSVHNIEIELDLNAAPIHSDNFLKHVQAGNYNGATFHRIIDDFMIQGGDFENGDGTGGYAYEWYGYCNGQAMNSSAECSNSTIYTIPDEADNGLVHTSCKISMAKTSSPNTGGSQFFIMPGDISQHTWLDGVHTVFGEVTSGCNSITLLSEVQTGNSDIPSIPVVINSATIISNPTADSDGDGVIDTEDEFPNDANETQDSDGDGVGDNSDEFPQDSNETHDDDGDGVGNNTDAFPQDGNETHDDDGDGVGNNTDAFPQDANETMDTDGDGVGDNADPEPEDPSISSPADIEVNVSDTSAYLISGAIVFLAIVIIFVRRKPPSNTDENYTQFAYQDSLFNED